MGICESPLEKSNQLTENVKPKIIQTKKPITPVENDEKSDDTMKYQKIGLNESYNIETNIKKREENSMDEKEKSTNDTIQPQINQEIKNKDLNLMVSNHNKSYVSNNIQQGLSQNLSQRNNNSNNFNHLLNTNSGIYSKNLNNEKNQMNNSLEMSNNFNKSGQLGYNNKNLHTGSNILNNNSKINVSLHESHISGSAFLNIPKQDNDPISAINSVSETLFISQKND